MATYTDEEWEEIGSKWREAAAIADILRVDAPEFVRWMKRTGYVKNYLCVPDHALPTAEGKYEPNEGFVYYRQSVWAAAERGDPHSNWTVMHEASHALRNHTDVRYRAYASHRTSFSRQTNRDEFEANRLTASILAPFDRASFRLGMTAVDISKKFGLSLTAAAKRLEQFEGMYRRKHRIPRPSVPNVIDFLAEQARKGYTVKNLNQLGPMLPTATPQYEGDPCPVCEQFALLRNGLSVKCDCCGARIGDD